MSLTPTQPCADPAPDPLVDGIALFNRGEFFACHEVLEALWLAERRPIRALVQGIIQIAVGFYHLERGKRRGAVYGLSHGSVRIAPFAPACYGVDVACLITDVQVALAWIDAIPVLDADALDAEQRPQIRFTARSVVEPAKNDALSTGASEGCEGDPGVH